MSRFAASVGIAKDSWAILMREKELATIPVVSFVCTVATMAAVGAGVWFSLDETVAPAAVSSATGSTSEIALTPLSVAVGIVGYLLITFVVTFFTAALVAGAHQALTGGSTSFGQAMGAAGKRVGPIFGWAMLTGTVGLVLDAIQERLGFIGDIIVGLVGAAWNIVTWLAIPVVIVEGTGPITSLKTSAGLFKKTWGENLIAQAGLGLVSFLVLIPVVLVATVVGLAIPALGIGLGVLGVGVVLVVFSALGGIYRTALYLYASQGVVVDGFSSGSLEAAFTVKSGRRR